METINEVFAYNCRTLRGERPQRAIADLAELDLRVYQRIEAGQIPQDKNLFKVAEALGVPSTRLFVDPDLIEKMSIEASISALTKFVQDAKTALENPVIQSVLALKPDDQKRIGAQAKNFARSYKKESVTPNVIEKKKGVTS